MIVGFFPVSFSLMMALETFAGEKERNSLEALFSSPLSDRALYFGKTLAALVPPVLASYLSMFLYFSGVVAAVHYRPDFGLLAAVAVLDLAQALVMVAAALIISSHTTSVRAANLLASFIILPMSLVLQFNNLFVIWGAAPYLWLVALGLGVFALLLLRMGLRLFNREDILTREIDEVKGGQIWASYRRYLALPPRWALLARTPDAPPVPPRLQRPTLRRLYLHDIPMLLRLRCPGTGAGGADRGRGLQHRLESRRACLAPGRSTTPPGSRRPPAAGQATLVSNGQAAAALAEIPLVLIVSALLAGVLIVLALISFGTLALLFMMLIAGLFGFLLGSLAGLGLPPAGAARRVGPAAGVAARAGLRVARCLRRPFWPGPPGPAARLRPGRQLDPGRRRVHQNPGPGRAAADRRVRAAGGAAGPVPLAMRAESAAC